MENQTDPTNGLWTLARALGNLRWVERSMFEVAGEWGRSTEDPAARVLFAAHSMHHGWHAEVLYDRLPELRDLDVETLTVAPGPGWVAAFDRLCTEVTSSTERLSVWFGALVPTLVDAYGTLLDSLGEVAAPSVRRWVAHILLDERADLADGLAQCRALGVELAGRSYFSEPLLAPVGGAPDSPAS